MGHVILCIYRSIENQVACSNSILIIYIFYLLVKGWPKFTHMTTNEYSAAQRRSISYRLLHWQINKFTWPSPSCINSILFVFSELFLFFLFDLFTNLDNNRDGYIFHVIITIKKTRQNIRHHSAMMIVFIL